MKFKKIRTALALPILVIILLLKANTASALDYEFTARMQPESFQVGDIVQYIVNLKVSGDSVSNVEFYPPDFEKFAVVGNSQQENIIMINGQKEINITRQYSLEALQSGEIKIEGSGVSFVHQGKKEVLESNSVTANAKKGLVQEKKMPFKQSATNEQKKRNQIAKNKDNSQEVLKNYQPKQNQGGYGLKSEVEEESSLWWILSSVALILLLSVISFFLINFYYSSGGEKEKDENSEDKEEEDSENDLNKALEKCKNNKEKFLYLASSLRKKLEKQGEIKPSMTLGDLKKLAQKNKISREVLEILEIGELIEYGKVDIDDSLVEKTLNILLSKEF